MISKKLAIEVLNVATSTGADFAEIYLEENNSSSISLDNCKVESCNDSLTYGAGIRLLKGLQSVYGYTNDLSKKGLTFSNALSGISNIFHLLSLYSPKSTPSPTLTPLLE